MYPQCKYYGDFPILHIVATALEIKVQFLLFSIVELFANIQIKHELRGEPEFYSRHVEFTRYEVLVIFLTCVLVQIAIAITTQFS